MKIHYIISSVLLLLIIILWWIVTYQSNEISKIRYETSKIKMQWIDNIESDEQELVLIKQSILHINDRMNSFIEVHDSNVDVIDEMYVTIEEIIDYLSN